MTRETAIAITSTDLQRNYGEILHRVTRHRLEFIITTHGREEMAVISVERYNELLEEEKKAEECRLEALLHTSS